MERWQRARDKESRLIVGLNSGTSMDGVDAILVRVRGHGLGIRHEILAFTMVPFERELRDALLRAPDVGCVDVCRWNRELGRRFAAAAGEVARLAHVGLRDVDLVASHGQTICHLPDGVATTTLQIADLDVIAAETGCLVIGDFRAADVAHGGAGAPLMPYLDAVLFGDAPGTVTLNLGGITSLTWCPGGLDGVAAFDVGPCNVTLDLLAAEASEGRQREDTGGRLALAGTADGPVLDALLGHPYFLASPPKTTGREAFGGDYVRSIRARFPSISWRDLLASHTRLVGESIRRALGWVAGGADSVRQVIASGGGVHNAALMNGIREALAPAPVRSLSEVGIDPDAKEALLFAVLGNERLFCGPSNLPRITGATRPVSLGKLAGG